MTIYEKLIHDAKLELQRVKYAKDELYEIERKVKRLSMSDVLNIGTRVRLKEDWLNKEVGSGWSGCVHFMNPSNLATIKDICVDDLYNIAYLIEFDDEYCNIDNKRVEVNNKHLFHFLPKDIEVVL